MPAVIALLECGRQHESYPQCVRYTIEWQPKIRIRSSADVLDMLPRNEWGLRLTCSLSEHRR